MRVIAGSARRQLLKTLEGTDTRPTLDKYKETLFNVIQWEVPGSDFLDLFAGSGAIGIEALSRAARSAVFVENNRNACACIRENLRITHLEENAEVLSMDVMGALRRLEGNSGRQFHLIYLDPPYNKNLEQPVLSMLSRSSLADEDTWIIVEASNETDFSFLPELGYTVIKEKVYKTNRHLFLKKAGRDTD